MVTTSKIFPPGYDTRAYVKKLRQAQFTQEQAETIAEGNEYLLGAMAQQSETMVSAKDFAAQQKDFATRQDLKEVEIRLSQKISEVREDVSVLRQDMGVMRQDIGVMRQDIDGLRTDMSGLRTGQSDLRKDMMLEIANLHLALVKWQLGIGIGSVITFITILKYMHSL